MKADAVVRNNGSHWSRYIVGVDKYYKEGISWNAISSGKICLRSYDKGFLIGHSSVCGFCNDDKYVMAFLNTPVAVSLLQILSPTVNYGSTQVNKLPIRYSDVEKIDEIVQQNISLSKLDWDAHETSWDFQENELIRIAKAEKTGSLERALECYRSEWEDKFAQLHENEEELNRRFISIYGLKDELTPEVPLDEVTILQAGEITHIKDPDEYGGGHYSWNYDNLMKQLLSYAVGCLMGRYRLDRPGLAIAHPDPAPEELATYSFTDSTGEEHSFGIDGDGLIPLLPPDSGFSDNAILAVRQFIRDVFGEDSYAANLNFIENCLGKPLDEYLFRNFWADHKKMYQNRPIYWLFSSKKGAFKVLAYCHRMTRHTAELVRQRYLLPYIDRLKGRADEIQAKGAGATSDERRQLKTLAGGIAECEEYHTRLHAVADRQIAFDLDDGVLENHALFSDVLAKLK